MDYKEMWETLRKEIEKDLEYHKSGVMQSMSESIQGEIKCEEFLAKMNRIENCDSVTDSRQVDGSKVEIAPIKKHCEPTEPMVGSIWICPEKQL